jgi:O-methyltransferase domain
MVQLYRLPEFFEKRGCNCPEDAYDSPFQYAMDTKLHLFDWLAANPVHQHAFNVTMSLRSQQGAEAKWFETFPVEPLLKQSPESGVFLVDIGGSIGHHLIEFKESYPNAPGKLIVQDIAPVIDSIVRLPEGIESMVYDFFEPQPVKQAKIYFLSHILHDWPDKQAKIILQQIRGAMNAESVLLMSEAVMPEKGVPFVPAVMDLTMMAAFSSLERTEAQFKKLLQDAGLELVKVWIPDSTDVKMLGGTVLEARLKA